MWQLTAKIGKHKGASWTMADKPLLLGRGRHCDVVIRDPGVSREHGRIQVVEGAVLFEDLGSSNGSILNGEIVQNAELYAGDELLLGGVTFVISRVRQQGEDSTPTNVGTTVIDLRGARYERKRSEPDGVPRTIEDLYLVHELNMALGSCGCREDIVHVLVAFGREVLGADRCTWVAPDGERLLPDDDWVKESEIPLIREALEAGGPNRLYALPGRKGGEVFLVPVKFAGVTAGGLLLLIRLSSESDIENIAALAASMARSAGPYLHAMTDSGGGAPLSRSLDDEVNEQSLLVGDSEPMQRLRGTLAMAAKAEIPVLLHGETGSGKELCARFLHRHSSREAGPFVPLNCATLPEELFESELFGHEKGAFTGAAGQKTGLLAEAVDGILFLDEIAELSPRNQARLLRAIETGRYRPVGAAREYESNAWVIAASNVDLLEAVEFGEFREDLYYRLSVVEVTVPPLSERTEDIAQLVRQFVAELENLPPGSGPLLDEAEIAFLKRQQWPGNVRELKNYISRVGALAVSRPVPRAELETLLRRKSRGRQPVGTRVDDVEKEHISQVMRQCGGRMSEAAELLGIHRNTLRRKLKQYDIRR